jgi:hypothetical protein
MQEITDPPGVISPGADLDTLLGLRDRRQVEVLPSALSEKVTGKISFMQALHHQDNRIALLVVES